MSEQLPFTQFERVPEVGRDGTPGRDDAADDQDDAFVALGGEDSTLRGTALEYLENVLPEEMRGSLFPMLDVHVELEAAHSQGNETRARRVPRRRQELVRELSLSLPSLAQPRLPNDRGESPPE